MTQQKPHLDRRTALQTVAGTALVSVAGCLDGNVSPTTDGSESPSSGSSVFQQVTVDGTTLVVEFASDSELDQINLIQPNGELFGQREVAAGSQQVSFDLGTAYEPGEYEVFALRGEEEVGRSRRLFSQITRSWRWELAETSQRRCGMARKTRARRKRS